MTDETTTPPPAPKSETEQLQDQLTEAQKSVRVIKSQIEFLGTELATMVERFHALRVAHGDVNASNGFTQIRQHMDIINGQLNRLAQADDLS